MNQHDPIVGRYVYVQCEGKTYRTYYEENGEGIPMVCLHTAGTDNRQYRHQLCDPDITQNYRRDSLRHAVAWQIAATVRFLPE